MTLIGPSPGQSLAEWVMEVNDPNALGGTPATPTNMALESSTYASNLIRNGSFESWASGTTSAPDGWTLTGAGATLARSTATPRHLMAEVEMTAALNTATDLAQSLTISATENVRLRGRSVTFSVLVKVSTADRVFLKIDDGIGTTSSEGFHVGDGVYRLLYVTRLIDVAATKVEVSIEISSGASITATFDAAMLVEGDGPVGFVQHISDNQLVPRAVFAESTQTTASATPVALDSMSIANVIVSGKQSVHIAFTVSHENDGAGNRNAFQIERSGTRVPDAGWGDECTTAASGAGNDIQNVAIIYVDRKPAAGNYTYAIKWSTAAGNAYAFQRTLVVTVLPDE